MDVRENTTGCDCNATEELVKLLIIANRQLNMAGNDASLLVIACSVSGQLQNLGREVLQNSTQVNRSTSADA